MSVFATEDEIISIIKQVSTSDKGGFDYPEFISFMALAMDTLETQKEVDALVIKPEKKNNFITLQTARDEKWQNMFNLFADQQLNVVTRASFKTTTEKLGDKVTNEEMDEMFADIQGDGLTFEEFTKHMLNVVRS
jgi:Ca2+-binding EF-hand superfamily protein